MPTEQPAGQARQHLTKALRLITLMRLLDGRWRTAADLARETGFNVRTIHRDLIDLDSIGFPVEVPSAGAVRYRLFRGAEPGTLPTFVGLELAKSGRRNGRLA